MSAPELRFVSAPLPVGHAVYSAQDRALTYQHVAPPSCSPEQALRAEIQEIGFFAGRCGLIFRRQERDLVRIEAYTDKQNWSLTESLSVPAVAGEGVVTLVTPTESHAIRIGPDPQYTYSAQRNSLLVTFGDATCPYFRVSSNLLVALNAESRLVAAYIENMAICA